MKTKKNLFKRMGEYEPIQREDGMYFASGFLNEWNKNMNEFRVLSDFLEAEEIQAFIEVLLEKEKLKSEKEVYTEGWMHSFLFLKFVMWIDELFHLRIMNAVLNSEGENDEN